MSVGVYEVSFQVFQGLVIKLQPALEYPIGDTLLLLEECNDLCYRSSDLLLEI